MFGQRQAGLVRNRRTWVFGILTLVLILATSLGASAKLIEPSELLGEPMLATDKPAYDPGEIVTVWGTGFEANTTYDIPVIRPDGVIAIYVPPPEGRSIEYVPEDWQPGWESVTSDENGSFTYLYDLNGMWGAYEVRAYLNPWSGDLNETPIASVWFFDGDRDFKQCANDGSAGLGNCEWINGILQQSNSIYYEGMGVPQRTIFTDITVQSNDEHWLTFKHQATKGGAHAYDWLVSYDQAIQLALEAGVPFHDLYGQVCDDAIPGSMLDICNMIKPTVNTNCVEVEVPDDDYQSNLFANGTGSYQDRIDEFEAQYGNRTVTLCGDALITNASLTPFAGPPPGPPGHEKTDDSAADDYIHYQLNWTSESSHILFLMAGHIASSAVDYPGWGPDMGASSISGGPYHFSLMQLDGAATGSVDNQIKGADIQEVRAKKSGYKWHDLNADGNWDLDEPALSGWTIWVDYNDNGIIDPDDPVTPVYDPEPFAVTQTDDPLTIEDETGFYEITGIQPGTWKVKEEAQAGWTCSSPNPCYHEETFENGLTYPDNNFGNYQNVIKSGSKFGDTNSDHSWQQPDEPALDGWTIRVYDGVDTEVASAVTGAAPWPLGYYEFSLKPGTYKVCEDVQPGYNQTFPQVGTGILTCPNGTLGYEITLISGEPAHTDNNFGNTPVLPSITLDKSGDELSKIGDEVTYTITIENTSTPGTPALECIVSDAQIEFSQPVTLNPGDVQTWSPAWTIPADASDPYVNTASATCTYVDSTTEVASASDGHSIDLFQPSVEVIKEGDTLSKIGDEVTYDYTINNTSSADSPSLNLVSVLDTGDNNGGAGLGNLTAAASAAGCDILASGGSCNFSVSYTVLEGDDDPLDNRVDVLYNPDGFPNPITDWDDHTVQLFQPAIELTKTGDEESKVGDDVTYTIGIVNTSSADSPDLTLDSFVDSLVAGVVPPGACSPLAPTAGCTFDYTYTVQPGDPDPLVNTATAVYNPDGFLNEISGSDTWRVDLFWPEFSITKTGDELSKIGDDVTYTFTIENLSSTDQRAPIVPVLNLVSIVDDKLGDLSGPATTVGCDVLDLGEICSFQVTHTIPDDASDPYENEVTAVYGVDEFPNQVTRTAQHSVNLFQPAIELTKTGDELSKIGDPVDYTITLDNNSSPDTPNLECRVTDALVGVDETFTMASGDAPHVINVNGFEIPAGAGDPFANTAEVICSPIGFLNEYDDDATWE
ncbi:MAG: hypothetical protein U9R25_20475, partial [Chloroflexota bacterium]|nr:hypothetical protein [Chloroflexota bacterium]